MSEITQKYKGWARKITIKSDYPNVKLSVKLPRSSTIRIKRDESRKQGDKDTHQRNGSNSRNQKDKRLQNSDTLQGDINCTCEPQRGIRGDGLSCRELQHPHGILDLWKKTKRISPDVPEIQS